MFCLRKTAEFRLRETSTFVAILFSLTTVEMVRFELMTPCLPDKCSPSELHPRILTDQCLSLLPFDRLRDDRHLYLYIKRNNSNLIFEITSMLAF